jgi:hypothetical protein
VPAIKPKYTDFCGRRDNRLAPKLCYVIGSVFKDIYPVTTADEHAVPVQLKKGIRAISQIVSLPGRVNRQIGKPVAVENAHPIVTTDP